MKAFCNTKGQTFWRSRAHRAWFRLCEVCLSLYIGYVGWLAGSALFAGWAQTVTALGVYALVCLGVYRALDAVTGLLCDASPRTGKTRAHTDVRVFLLAFGIALAVFGSAFAACYPGGVNYDISNQWRQVHSGEYNNWHPVFHTLLMRGLTLICDSYPFCVLVQIVVFAALLSYVTATLHRQGVPAWLALAVHALTALTPLVRNTLMYLGKDSAMTLGVLALTAQAVNLLYSRGAWLQKPVRAVGMGLLLGAVSLLRVNALLWTLPFLLCAFFAYRPARRQTALAACVMAGFMALVQGPVYGALDVVYPHNTVEESVGLPMTVLCDIRQREPEKLDAQTTAFLARLAPDEVWETAYVPHSYNSVKFTYPREYIKEMPLTDILGMSARAAAAAPRTAFEAVNGLTGLVWDITGRELAYQSVRNSGEIESARYGSARLNAMGGRIVGVFDAVMGFGPIRYLTRNLGVQLLLLLLVTLWALRRHGCQVLLLALPTLLYSLGTMLLLCGNDARFFHFALTVSLPSLLALLYLPRDAEP